MSKFDNERVITFRVGSEAERLALDRLADDRRMSRAEVLRALVRRALIADMDLRGCIRQEAER